MIKAVFIDYTGTTVQESGKEMKEVVMRICQNSTLQNPDDVMKLWWSTIKQYENECYQESYLTGNDIVDRALNDFVRLYQLKENLTNLHNLIQEAWVNAPIFPDVPPFYEACPVPIYIVSNNGVQYVEKAMKRNHLSPAGIICADMVRAYKPHKELFEKALEISGCHAEETIHIGDSYQSDVQGASSAGIKPILIQRSGVRTYEAVTVVQSLLDVLPLLKD